MVILFFFFLFYLQSAVRIASSNEDSTPTCVYHTIMRGLERLVVSFALSSAESDSLVKLSVDRYLVHGRLFLDRVLLVAVSKTEAIEQNKRIVRSR